MEADSERERPVRVDRRPVDILPPFGQRSCACPFLFEAAASAASAILEELGPSFIKLGQLMSTRADLFPPEYIDEFTKLQDQVPPVPFDGIRRLIEDELGQPLDQLFDSIDETAMAAASVAQVHTARLKTGEKWP
jgi:predicted unusual protein kinase regulating ubiquinone biosynthesis (AarF/ABC1/UbiB family)